jgi:hypothetical protein
MVPWSPPSEITSPLVRAMFDYWQLKRAGRVAPRRPDIEPGDIRRLLPYLSIADVIEEPFDLRYRLVGSAVAEAAGYDFTGHFLRDMPVTTGIDCWAAHYRRVVIAKRPFYGRYRGDLWPDLIRYADHGAFPLSSDGVTIDRIIEIEDWSGFHGVSLAKVELPIWRFEPLQES